MNNIKEIDYRGILKFNIPFDWVEEYDDEHGGTFYEDSPLSATLRLKLMTLHTPKGSFFKDAKSILDNIIKKGSEAMLLPNDNALKMFFEQTVDSGHEITIYYWSLVQFLRPNHVRLSNFSYTVLTNRLGIETVRDEIEFITEQVKNAQYSIEQ
ncbi:hypothetical protein [Flagellimonas flava]|uniref:hypothetical protein n=1 Tax=Flagellimonas flava TaxID=570519 RepID=UPI003D64CAC9